MGPLPARKLNLEDTTLQEILDLGIRLLSARYGALGVLNSRGDALARFITAGIGERARAAIGPLPEGKGLLGALIRDPRPLRLSDMRLDPRSVGFPPRHPPMRSFLGVPVFSMGKIYGNFYFTEKLGTPEFSAADERLAENFARLAGQAVVNPAARAGVRRDLDTFRGAAAQNGAVIITNPAREIILWNEGARDLFGYTEAEALGRRIEDLIVPEEERAEWRMRYIHQHVRALRAGRTVRHETMRLRKNGGEITVSVALSPILSGTAGMMALTGAYKITRA